MTRSLQAILAAALLACAGVALAQNWPTKPVRFIVSTPPGTSPDVIGRMLSDRLSRAFGQGFFVESIAGAGGLIASRTAAKADPDGYTLFFAGTGALILDPFMIKDLGYSAERDYSLIAMIYSEGSLGVAVNPEVPAKTLSEFIALVKKKPGAFTYGTTNVAYTILFGKWLQKLTDMDMVAVAYKVQGQQVQDVIAGRTQMIVCSPPNVEVHVRAGKLRMIAIDGFKPHPLMPGVDLMANTLPGWHMSGLGVLAAPAGTAESTVRRLNVEMDKIVRSPEYQKLIEKMGFAVEGAGAPPSIVKFVSDRREDWRKVMTGLNVQPE
jgi:tripartite-type tricarboxylate transporter receptor subunit TctC